MFTPALMAIRPLFHGRPHLLGRGAAKINSHIGAGYPCKDHLFTNSGESSYLALLPLIIIPYILPHTDGSLWSLWFINCRLR